MVSKDWRFKVKLSAVITVVVGILTGAVISPMVGLTEDAAESFYDRIRPVASARAEIIAKTPTSWLVVLYTQKHRDCSLMEVQAFDISMDRSVVRLDISKENGKPNSSMPIGNFRSSNYIVVPPPKHDLVMSYLHLCNGRVIRTPIFVKA